MVSGCCCGGGIGVVVTLINYETPQVVGHCCPCAMQYAAKDRWMIKVSQNKKQ
jgi:hypothetical protein